MSTIVKSQSTIVKSQSALVNAVKTITDKASQLASLVVAYTADYSQFAQANNRDRLTLCASAFSTERALHKALSSAMGAGFVAGALSTGFISRGTGGFDKQSEDIQKPFNTAIERATLAFENSLIDSGLFADKAKKTEVEKAQAKEAKEAKAKEAKEAMITAMIQRGELVRAADVHSIDAIALLAEVEALKAENDALKAELAVWNSYKASYDKAIASSVA